MIDFRNNLSKNNEIHRKKLLDESELLLQRHQQKKREFFKNFFALILSTVSSLVISCIFPFLLDKEIISPWDFFWIVPSIIVFFISIYYTYIFLYWVYKNLVRCFQPAESKIDYDNLKALIDNFDINIMSYVDIYFCSLNDYKTTTEMKDCKMFEFLHLKYYLNKTISSLSSYTPQQLSNILYCKNDKSYLLIEQTKIKDKNQRTTNKIEYYRYETILSLLDKALDDFDNVLSSETDAYILKFKEDFLKDSANYKKMMNAIKDSYNTAVTNIKSK